MYVCCECVGVFVSVSISSSLLSRYRYLPGNGRASASSGEKGLTHACLRITQLAREPKMLHCKYVVVVSVLTSDLLYLNLPAALVRRLVRLRWAPATLLTYLLYLNLSVALFGGGLVKISILVCLCQSCCHLRSDGIRACPSPHHCIPQRQTDRCDVEQSGQGCPRQAQDRGEDRPPVQLAGLAEERYTTPPCR